jgi:ATP-dependent Clp protease protease subunit
MWHTLELGRLFYMCAHRILKIADTSMGPPPDLPSLLLNERIIYLGMPIVPQVTELIVAQLLFLSYESDRPITM